MNMIVQALAAQLMAQGAGTPGVPQAVPGMEAIQSKY